jgi:hypothetical protein
VNLVLANPFRILGLPASATSREIARRVADLSVDIPLGRSPTFPLDQPSWGAIQRTIQDIESAAAAVDDVEGRWLNGLFWFRSVDAIDELALESLSTGKAVQALRLWDQRIARGGRDAMSCLLNRSVLQFALASASVDARTDRFRMALDGLGRALTDYPLAARGDLPASRWPEMLRRLPQLLLAMSQSICPQAFGPEDLGLITAVEVFPTEVRDELRARLINPVFAWIESAILDSNQLEDALEVYARLRQAVGPGDVRLQVLGSRLSSAYFDWSALRGTVTEAVSESERQMSDLVETLPVTTDVLDQARVVRALNEAAAEVVIESLPEPEVEPEVEPEPEPEAEVVHEPLPESGAEPEPEVVHEPLPESGAEPEPEPLQLPTEPLAEPALVAIASTNPVDQEVPAFLRSVIRPDVSVENPAENLVESPVETSTEKSAELTVENLAHETVSQPLLPVQPETPALPDRSEQIAAAKRSLADRMQRPLASIEDATSMIDGSRPDLTKLKAMLGREDAQYLLACEAIATVALDHLVPTVDLEREKFDLANDPVAARVVLERAEIAARKLAMLDLGAEARERVARFLGALRDLLDQEAATATAAAGRKGLRLPPLVVGAGLAAASVAAALAWLMAR